MTLKENVQVQDLITIISRFFFFKHEKNGRENSRIMTRVKKADGTKF